MRVLTLWLFRHGETDYNRDGRFQGHLDIPLNETGRAQAQALVPKLKDSGLEVILSSDLTRTRQTAEILATGLGGVPIQTTPALREAYLGQAQGLTREEMATRFGLETLNRWRSSHPTDADAAFPDGERGEQVRDRALSAIHEFCRQSSYTRIGISTHGGVLRRVIQHWLLESNDPRVHREIPIPNGVIYTIEVNLTKGLWIVRGPDEHSR